LTRELVPHEALLVGQWISKNGKTIEDEISERITWLIRNSLKRMATDATGWDTLYKDPRDGRLWELTYPHSEMHGGGPPLLRALSLEDARAKYSL